ncbi:MAG TPA: ABC transporter permease [Chromatiales bacterium]|nr:ABC transporter permease [Chromatiales bacterium]
MVVLTMTCLSMSDLSGAAIGITEVIVAPVFWSAAFIMLLVVPLVTMRLISEERRNRTQALLFSAPISMTEIVLGKYLGVLAFLGIMLALISLMPLSLLGAGSLDPGQFAAGLLGLFLMLAAFAAAGLFMSTLTSHPAVAAVSTFGFFLLLWIINGLGRSGTDEAAAKLFDYLSLQGHYQSLLRGIFDTGDVIYYLLFIITFLTLSVRRLDADRLQS